MPLSFKSRARLFWPVGLVLVVGLGISGVLGWKLHSDAVELDRARLGLRIKQIMDQMDARLEKTELLLRQLQDFLHANDGVTPAQFRAWCGKHDPPVNFPWLMGIAVGTNAEVFSSWTDFPSPTESWPVEERKRFVRQSKRPLECKLTHSFSGPKDLAWPDAWSLSATMETPRVNSSVRENRMRVIEDYSTMLTKGGGLMDACCLLLPLYDTRLPDLIANGEFTAGQRQHVRWILSRGIIVAPINFAVLEQSLWSKTNRDVGVEIFTSTDFATAKWLNRSSDKPRALDSSFRPYLTRVERWRMYVNKFHIFFYTTPLFDAQSPRGMAWIAAGAGTGMTLLAGTLVGVLLTARTRQEEMTEDVLEARDALAAAEKEREKLGHDLHDGAIQSLYAVQLGLTRTAEDVAASVPAASQMLCNTRHRLDEVIAELRSFILASEEAPQRNNHIGLDDVLAAMVQRLQATTGARLLFEGERGAADQLSTNQAVQVTQIARTALANSLRHAQARHVNVRLRERDGKVCLEVTDDGVGFDGAAVSGGLGLKTMRSRASEAGGTIEVESKPGRGTRIVVEIPRVKSDA